jgi:hypothetical protein
MENTGLSLILEYVITTARRVLANHYNHDALFNKKQIISFARKKH